MRTHARAQLKSFRARRLVLLFFFFFLLENKFIKFEVARLGNEYRRLFCYGCIRTQLLLYVRMYRILMF